MTPELLYGSVDSTDLVNILAFFPETCGDLLTCNEFAGVGDEQQQETEARWWNAEPEAAAAQFHTLRIELESSNSNTLPFIQCNPRADREDFRTSE